MANELLFCFLCMILRLSEARVSIGFFTWRFKVSSLAYFPGHVTRLLLNHQLLE